MLVIVVVLFGVCWLPLQMYNILQVTWPQINSYRYINIIWFFCDWLAMSNSCYNPFIYGIYNVSISCWTANKSVHIQYNAVLFISFAQEKFKREFRRRCPLCRFMGGRGGGEAGSALDYNDTKSMYTRATSIRSNFAGTSTRHNNSNSMHHYHHPHPNHNHYVSSSSAAYHHNHNHQHCTLNNHHHHHYPPGYEMELKAISDNNTTTTAATLNNINNNKSANLNNNNNKTIDNNNKIISENVTSHYFQPIKAVSMKPTDDYNNGQTIEGIITTDAISDLCETPLLLPSAASPPDGLNAVTTTTNPTIAETVTKSNGLLFVDVDLFASSDNN